METEKCDLQTQECSSSCIKLEESYQPFLFEGTVSLSPDSDFKTVKILRHRIHTILYICGRIALETVKDWIEGLPFLMFAVTQHSSVASSFEVMSSFISIEVLPLTIKQSHIITNASQTHSEPFDTELRTKLHDMSNQGTVTIPITCI